MSLIVTLVYRDGSIHAHCTLFQVIPLSKNEDDNYIEIIYRLHRADRYNNFGAFLSDKGKNLMAYITLSYTPLVSL